jgi:hypothetical protein
MAKTTPPFMMKSSSNEKKRPDSPHSVVRQNLENEMKSCTKAYFDCRLSYEQNKTMKQMDPGCSVCEKWLNRCVFESCRKID